MPDRLEHDFPLFPLGLVALPHEYVPLHLFEERYKALAAEVLSREGGEFGILWASEEGLHRVGCAMEITRVLEELPDGRLNVLTRGTRVFRLVEDVHDRLPYPAGTIEVLEDAPGAVDPEVAGAARDAYRRLVELATDKEPEDTDFEVPTAYGMAATVDFGLEAKQNLLELRSEEARLKLVTRLFRAATKRLEFIEKAQVRAKSNGKVRFG